MFSRGLNLIASSIALLITICAHGAEQRGGSQQDFRIKLYGERFDISETSDVEGLRVFTAGLIEQSGVQGVEFGGFRDQLLGDRTVSDLNAEERLRYFHLPDETIGKKERRGLIAISSRVGLILANPDAQHPGDPKQEILELAASVANIRRNPIPNVGMSSLFTVFDQLFNTVGGGVIPASNIQGSELDCSRSPLNSTFWTDSGNISKRDLYVGFGRKEIPRWSKWVWEYDKPKISRGANPGFEIRSGKYKAKIKFAETHSEPFTTRVFHALGYNVDVTDYVSHIRLKYDRRLFLEFNLRQKILLNIRFFGMFTMGRVNMQGVLDPFDYLVGAELYDGTSIGGDELRRQLLVDHEIEPGELTSDSLNKDFESEIRYLITSPINFQIDEQDVKSVGPWAFDELGHEELRELRGVALLAAWLGWFDCRFDNTRLRVVNSELLHYFSDLGGGLGRTDAAFNWRAESINDFPWTFTEAPIVRGPGRMTTPFKVANFHTIVDNTAFKAMTIGDAKWMAGLIAQLTVQQIEEALIASGYDIAETVLYREKLIHRRNRMITDLGLNSKYPALPKWFESTEFDYDPIIDERTLGLPDEQSFAEDPFGSVVENGVLVHRSEK